jgi:hypothetical protein
MDILVNGGARASLLPEGSTLLATYQLHRLILRWYVPSIAYLFSRLTDYL